MLVVLAKGKAHDGTHSEQDRGGQAEKEGVAGVEGDEKTADEQDKETGNEYPAKAPHLLIVGT